MALKTRQKEGCFEALVKPETLGEYPAIQASLIWPVMQQIARDTPGLIKPITGYQVMLEGKVVITFFTGDDPVKQAFDGLEKEIDKES